MNMGWVAIIIFGIAVAIGWVIQNLTEWSSLRNLGLTLGSVLILPPAWSAGLTVGVWICCAFWTDFSQDEANNESPPKGWLQVIGYALFTFSGFILTLFWLWRLKTELTIALEWSHEILGWLYFGVIEISFYKLITRFNPRWNWFQVGYGIGFLDALLIAYWILPYGLLAITLTVVTLMIANPLLLLALEQSAGKNGRISLGGNR